MELSKIVFELELANAAIASQLELERGSYTPMCVRTKGCKCKQRGFGKSPLNVSMEYSENHGHYKLKKVIKTE